MAANDRITLVEVGPRDGLQNESAVVPAATKIELIERVAACGVTDMDHRPRSRPPRRDVGVDL